MNRDDIIRMAREADEAVGMDLWVSQNDSNRFLEIFAYLVAAHEREACAKVCEGLRHIEQVVANERFAREVRARGEQ